MRSNLAANGFEAKKFDVDVLRMNEDFKQHKMKNTAENRTEYVAQMERLANL
ncbi:MAG TPA: hypothetical protein VKA49_10620 [Flavitalea sp.]|nr:hypothetical protein [Flavitalea sp.]